MPSRRLRLDLRTCAVDLANACLWRGARTWLRPSLRRAGPTCDAPGRLVTKGRAVDAIGPRLPVSDAVVSVDL